MVAHRAVTHGLEWVRLGYGPQRPSGRGRARREAVNGPEPELRRLLRYPRGGPLSLQGIQGGRHRARDGRRLARRAPQGPSIAGAPEALSEGVGCHSDLEEAPSEGPGS